MLTKREQRRVDSCEVIVVGAGLVGALVAARLTREGFDTAILEARRVTGGATGRSLGMVLVGLPQAYSWAVSVYGRQRAREIWALTVGGRDRLVEAAEQLAVPIQRTASLALAANDKEADVLWESARLLREDGFDVSYSLTDPLNRGFEAALHQNGGVMVNAAVLTRALLTAEGVTVHEGTEVYALEPTGDDIRVWAHRRTVLCRAVVLAVNGYAPLVHPYLAENIAPVSGVVFAAGPLEDVLLEQPCTAGQGRESLRSLPDGRLLVGTWGRRESLTGEDHPEDTLSKFVSRHFPEVDLSSADRWSEVMGFTADGLPLLGRLPDLPEVYFAAGFGGRGLSWAFVAADQLVDAMLRGSHLGLLSAERLR
ncbi:MAG: FAD-dependent oxidoreductase [Anaerolineae bacterium]|jgi:glycine/D-amino acid oxidase-like deaminating enzyme